MNLSQPRKSIRISQERPEFEVQHEIPTFSINTRKLRADMNIHTSGDFANQFRDEGRAAVFRGISRNVQEGNFIGDLRNPGDRISQVARNRAMSEAIQRPETNIALMPRDRPEVTWSSGLMSINWTSHSLVIDWDGDHMPRLTIDPEHSVDVFLRNEPYIRISVEEIITPGMSGQFVDDAI
jgi:hypothetical protein